MSTKDGDGTALARLASLKKPVSELSLEERAAALKLAEETIRELESPEQQVMRYVYQIGVDLSIFQNLVKAGGPVSLDDLCKMAGAEPSLVIRFTRMLSAIYMIDEVGPQMYKANAVTRCLTQPEYEATVRLAFDGVDQIYAKLPEQLKERKYRNPTKAEDCPLQWTFQTDKTYFPWIMSIPQHASDLGVAMKVMTQSDIYWTDFYPLEKRLLSDFKDGSDFLVDVGGGSGADLQTLLQRFPKLSGKVVLQDLPGVIDALDAERLQGIRAMAHDFLTPQPIQGAKAYFTHRVVHNWSDDKVVTILTQLRDAMQPNYSRILLNETLLPDTGCPAFDAAGDINMMSIMAALKRSESNLSRIIDSVENLKLVEVWRSADPANHDCVFELVRT